MVAVLETPKAKAAESVTPRATVKDTPEITDAEVYRVGGNFLVAPVGEKHSHLVYKNEKSIDCTCQHDPHSGELPQEFFECDHIKALRRAHRRDEIRSLDRRSPLEALFDKPLRREGEIETGRDGTPYIPWEVVVERLSTWLTYSGWGFKVPSGSVYNDPWMAGMVDEHELDELTKGDTIEINGPNRIVVVDDYTFNLFDAEEYKDEVKSMREAFVKRAEARQKDHTIECLGIGIELMVEDPSNDHAHPTKPVIVGPLTFMDAFYCQ